MKNSGLFLNMAKWCFFGLFFFEVLMVLWFVFCVSGIVAKVLKMLVFPSCFGFCVVAYYCLLGFGRFRCFVVLVLLFFCSGFVFVCFSFGCVLLLGCCWCWSCFVLVFLLCFVFFLVFGFWRV